VGHALGAARLHARRPGPGGALPGRPGWPPDAARPRLPAAPGDPERREQQLEDLLAEFSITRIRTARASTLSGGERRRTEIARALAARPRYILLDEPLAGIDPIAVSEIRDMVIHLKDRGMGVLITDHNVRDALKIVDRAYIMSEGSILTEGSPKEIIRNEDVRRVYLGESFSL
jgi:lipopolysaccharide export system ATP-binding protein